MEVLAERLYRAMFVGTKCCNYVISVPDCPAECFCHVNCAKKVTCKKSECPLEDCICPSIRYYNGSHCILPMPDPCLPSCIHNGAFYRVSNCGVWYTIMPDPCSMYPYTAI